MPLGVFLAVLAAALVHAGWNVLIKGADDKLSMTLAVALGAAVIAALVLPFLPMPTPASWPFIAGSVLLQSVYYLLIARAYRIADMSLAYPLMRGTAPLIVALSDAAVFGEMLSGGEWLAVAMISAGVLALALGAIGRSTAAGPVTALANAMVIAAYTLLDGTGARLSASPIAYTLTLAILTGAVTVGMALSGGARPRFTVRLAGLGLIGGAATTLTYGVALWAMTLAPVAPVAALRETSIVFALLLTRLFVGEQIGRRRLVAAGLVVAGVMALRLA